MDQTLTERPPHERLRVAALLAVVGGFLDAYTYILKGGVFANAQTGNMVLFGISLAQLNFRQAGLYSIPILAFALGVLLTNVLKHHYSGQKFKRHEPRILLAEIILLFLIGLAPRGIPDALCNVTISFICSLQVNSFRKVHELPYASTMCTGNLRSGMEKLFLFFTRKEARYLRESLHYGGIITCFIAGAVIGVFLMKAFAERSLWLCCILLGVVLIYLVRKQRRVS